MSKYSQVITEAFEDPQIIKLTNQAIARDPQNLGLLEAIATYHIDQKRKWTSPGSEPASKKRKLDNGTLTVTHNGSAGAWSDLSAANVITYPGISFSIPQRKKLTLQIVPNTSGRGGGIRALGAEGSLEFGLPWTDVEQLFCLPVPEKAKPQTNFVVIPRGGEGFAPAAAGTSTPEPIVWTEIDSPELSTTKDTLRAQLKAFGKDLIEPKQLEFFSALPQSHRKGEKAYHVKAFKGSKDGFLYFLSSGIIFAFKKPILFFPFHAVSSISYTSVLQRTFNLVITTQSVDGSEGDGQETEFSMLDQADYAGIDEYIQRHGLNDSSLAASRKAQRFGVNDPKNKAANGAAGDGTSALLAGNGEEEESELLKAERMLQDEEDEDEEDYDPGSDEDDSDGSGSDSDDDDDDEDGGEHDEEDEDEEGEGEGEEGEEEEGEEGEEEEEEEEEVGNVSHLPDEPEGGFI